jgi:hypothetical protein
MPCTLRGCSAIDFCIPPTNTLAPRPGPTAALAATPPYLPASAPLPMLVILHPVAAEEPVSCT